MALTLAACSTKPETKQITLLAEDIEWSSDLIEAEAGQMIELTITNTGALDHDFVIEELDLDILLVSGQSETVTFVVNEAGTYEYICNIPGHQDAGMVGELVISGGD
jgi:nitrite reductase (NO-forming)